MHFTVIPAQLVPSSQEWLLPAIGAAARPVASGAMEDAAPSRSVSWGPHNSKSTMVFLGDIYIYIWYIYIYGFHGVYKPIQTIIGGMEETLVGSPMVPDGVFHGKCHRSKWMMTRGTPMTQETPIWVQSGASKIAFSCLISG